MLETHIVVPEIVFNGVLCALASAAGWHVVALLTQFVRRRPTNRS